MTRRHPGDPDPFASHIIKSLASTADDRGSIIDPGRVLDERIAVGTRSRTPVARRLLAAATRFLPPAEQARYREELRAELDAIMTAGGSRRAQLAYAARQLASSWQLRTELRALRRMHDNPAEAAQPDTLEAVTQGIIRTSVFDEVWATMGRHVLSGAIEKAELQAKRTNRVIEAALNRLNLTRDRYETPLRALQDSNRKSLEEFQGKCQTLADEFSSSAAGYRDARAELARLEYQFEIQQTACSAAVLTCLDAEPG
jgi:hypothetical protein